MVACSNPCHTICYAIPQKCPLERLSHDNREGCRKERQGETEKGTNKRERERESERETERETEKEKKINLKRTRYKVDRQRER